MIRPAQMKDLESIIELGVESLEVNDPYPEMVISREKIANQAREVIASARHFAWVSEKGGEVVGAVCALSHPCMFYERSQASVLLYYCKVPGDGVALIRQLVKWFKERPILKMLMFTLEGNADPRLERLLTRLELNKILPNYLMVK